MLTLRKPSSESLRRFLDERAHLPVTYSAVGATANTPPAGYNLDHTRTKLGMGEAIFQAAKAALRRWEQFQLGWVEAWPRDTPIVPGQPVVVMGRLVGLWRVNACRIVYVIDEASPVQRFGFAYGTLPGHVESGEERFMVEWDPRDNDVWYDIRAFSKPNHLLTKLGYPIMRRLQKRFARESTKSLVDAVRRL